MSNALDRLIYGIRALFNDGDEVVTKDLNFVPPLSLTPNPATDKLDVEVDFSSLESAIEDLGDDILGIVATHPGAFFGSGSDGDLTASSGTTTLTRDTYYNNVTLTGTAKIDCAGFRLFVAGELDLSGAAAGAIQRDGTDVAAGSNNGVAGLTPGTLGGSGAGGNGASASGTNTNGSQGSQASSTLTTPSNGGASGTGGAGGTSNTSKTGGAASVARTPSNYSPIQAPTRELTRNVSLSGTYLPHTIHGGCGASGASSGGGSASGSGGVGNGGSAGGGVVQVWARKLRRSASTGVGAIRARGGQSSAGTYFSNPATNAGGCSGAPGAGGGVVHVYVGELLGSAATNMITAPGGQGQNGQPGDGAGTAGNGGYSGGGGEVLFVNFGTGAVSYLAPSAAVANSGQTGGVPAVQGITV